MNPTITPWPGNFGLTKKRHVGNGETISNVLLLQNKTSFENTQHVILDIFNVH